VKNVLLSDTLFHHHSIRLDGRNSEALVEVILCANRRQRKIISLIYRFNSAGNAQNREFIVKPVWMDRDTRLISTTFPEEARCSFKLSITWKPLATDSFLKGDWNVEGISYAKSREAP